MAARPTRTLGEPLRPWTTTTSASSSRIWKPPAPAERPPRRHLGADHAPRCHRIPGRGRQDVVLPTTMRYSTGTRVWSSSSKSPVPSGSATRPATCTTSASGATPCPIRATAFSAAGCPLQLCGRAGGTGTDVVRLPPGRRTRDPRGTGRRVHARRHAVPLRARTARRLIGETGSSSQFTAPDHFRPFPDLPPIRFIMLSSIANPGRVRPPDRRRHHSSGTGGGTTGEPDAGRLNHGSAAGTRGSVRVEPVPHVSERAGTRSRRCSRPDRRSARRGAAALLVARRHTLEEVLLWVIRAELVKVTASKAPRLKVQSPGGREGEIPGERACSRVLNGVLSPECPGTFARALLRVFWRRSARR